MAVTAEVDCSGAHGTAAPFVVAVSVGNTTVTQESVTHQPVPRTGGDWWAWSVTWQLEGHQVVTLTDTTNDGAVTHEVATYELDCPTPNSTTASNPEQTLVSVTEPTVTVGVEPSVSVPLPILVPVEVAPETTEVCAQEDDPCWNCATMGNLICGSTTTTASTTSTVWQMPATGADHGPALGAASLFVAFGVVSVLAARRPKSTNAPQR